MASAAASFELGRDGNAPEAAGGAGHAPIRLACSNRRQTRRAVDASAIDDRGIGVAGRSLRPYHFPAATVASTSGVAASGETQWLAMQSKPRAQSRGLEHAVRQPVTPQPKGVQPWTTGLLQAPLLSQTAVLGFHLVVARRSAAKLGRVGERAGGRRCAVARGLAGAGSVALETATVKESPRALSCRSRRSH